MTIRQIKVDRPTYLPTYDGCYVCGQAHPRGLQVHFFVGADHTQTGYKDIVHGGVISALLDELLGWPIALQTGRMVVTGEMTVRFLKPMSAGRSYLATARPGINRGKYWEGKGDIRDEHDEVYAKARGKYFLLSAEQTAAVAQDLTYQPGDSLVFRYKKQTEDKIPLGQSVPA
jgi:uncharacterized protein (TIGR00369 family)